MNRGFHWRLALAGSVAAMTLILPAMALAGDAIETVTVTAEKRSENIQSVPMSITALSGDQLQQIGAQNFEDYANAVPGLSFIDQGGPGQKQLVLRGITTGNSGNAATVGILVDDIPYGATNGVGNGGGLALDLATFDLNRIEVLRGPQGTLYGALAMGGLIKYVTNSPDSQSFAGALEAGLQNVPDGSTGYDVKGMLNVPLINGQLAIRGVGLYENSPNYIDNVGTGKKNAYGYTTDGGRVAVEYTPTNKLTVDVAAILQNINQADAPIVDVNRATHAPIYCDLCRSTVGEPYFKQEFRLYSAQINWDLDFATLTSLTSYSTIHSKTRNDFSEFLTALGLPPGFGYFSDVGFSTRKTTQEIRLASPSDQKLEWLIGGYYDTEKTANPNLIHVVNPAGGAVPPLNPIFSEQLPSTFQEEAVFGNVRYHLTDAFDVGAGVRYDHEHQTFNESETGLFVNGNFGPPVAFQGSVSDSATTWSFDTRYRFETNDMLYARVASGFRPGGANLINPFSSVQPTFGPDKLWNYEVGAKTEWLDGRLLANLSLYWIDWSDIQISVFESGFPQTANAGNARSRGLEFETVYVPTDGLTLGFNSSYDEATMVSLNPAATIGASPGERLPQTPKWSFSGTADYTFPLGSDYSGDLGLSYSYLGDRTEGFKATPGVYPFTMRAYGTLDLRAGVTRGNYRLSLFVKNVTNKRGEVQGFTDQAVTPASPAQLYVSEPRTIGLTLSATY